MIVKVDAGDALPGVQRREAPPPQTAAARAAKEPTALTATSRGKGDGRSGWWVFGAGVIALIGFFVSWKAQQPYDQAGKAITVVLGFLAGGLLVYSIYGGATLLPGLSRVVQAQAPQHREARHVDGESPGDHVGQGQRRQRGRFDLAVRDLQRHSRQPQLQLPACSHRWTLQGSRRIRA